MSASCDLHKPVAFPADLSNNVEEVLFSKTKKKSSSIVTENPNCPDVSSNESETESRRGGATESENAANQTSRPCSGRGCGEKLGKSIPDVLERLRKSVRSTSVEPRGEEACDRNEFDCSSGSIQKSPNEKTQGEANSLAAEKVGKKRRGVDLDNLDNILHAQKVEDDCCGSSPDSRVVPAVPEASSSGRLNVCDVCHAEFSSRRVLFKHQKIHSKVSMKIVQGSSDCDASQDSEPSFTKEEPIDVTSSSQMAAAQRDLEKVAAAVATMKPLMCDICYKGFSTRKTLNRHKRNIHSIKSPMKSGSEGLIPAGVPFTQGEHSKPFSCDICHKGFSSRKTLGKHKRNIHAVFQSKVVPGRGEDSTEKSQSILSGLKRAAAATEKPFACEVCRKRFLRSKNLKAHERIHTNEKTFRCEYCPKTFHRNGDLKVHKRLHTGEKPYACDLCPKAFSHVGHFAIHKRVHAGEKPFQCKYCPKTFFRSGNLYSHLKVHTGDKKFKCEFCLLKFASVEELAAHKVIHDGVRRYRCKVCSKTFSSRSHLTVHKRIHSGEKRFKCEVCPKSFYRSDTLVSHIKTHTGEKVFPCNFCPVSLSTKGQLAYHMRSSHSIETEDAKLGAESILGI